MPTHIKFNFDYTEQTFLDFYNNLEKTPVGKRLKAVLPEGVSNYEVFQPFFEQFPFITKNDASLEISETLIIGENLPRILPSATGMLIFPLNGQLTLKTYEFKFADLTSTWAYAIKTTDVLTTTMVADIASTLMETVLIDGPIAINGQHTHSIHPDSAGTILLVLQIPISVSWDDVVTALTA
jgi:hypothetical protein